MKDIVNVAAVQMDIMWLEPDENLSKMEEFIRTVSAASPVDLIVFPELVNTGYITDRNREFAHKFIKISEKIPGPFTERLCQVAKEAKVNIAFGFSEAHQTIPATLYNSAVLIDRQGEILGIHRKLHIPSEEKHYFYPGSKISVFRTDFANVAMSICADNRFPEFIRILALKGAEIVCGLFNVPEYISPISSSCLPNLEYLASIRALENVNYFIACDRTGHQEGMKFRGKSVIAAPTGEILCTSKSNEEEVVFAQLSNDLLIADRGFNPVFRDRRPDLYSELCESF